jgi:hypothetical protein
MNDDQRGKKLQHPRAAVQGGHIESGGYPYGHCVPVCFALICDLTLQDRVW